MSIFKKIVFWGFYTFFLVLIVEVGLRIFDYVYPNSIFYDDSYNRYRGVPNAPDYDFKLNSKGFKDVEFPVERSNKYRILGIGDSFAYGVVPYQNNYLTLLEQSLNKQKKNVEIFNMGIPYTCPVDYLSILVDEGLAYKPDMVLLSFYVGNDYLEVDTRIRLNGKTRLKNLYNYSYVATLIYYLYTLQTKTFSGLIVHGKSVYCDTCASKPHEYYAVNQVGKTFVFEKESEAFKYHSTVSWEYVEKIKTLCDRKKIKLVVAILPDEMQVNEKLRDEVMLKQSPPFKKELWTNDQPNTFMANKLKNAQISTKSKLVYTKSSIFCC